MANKGNIKAVVVQLFNSPEFVEDIVNKLTEPIHQVFSDMVAETNKKFDTLANEVQSLTAKCDEFAKCNESLNKRIDYLEQNRRRKNLRVFGITDGKDEDTSFVGSSLIRTTLKVDIKDSDLASVIESGSMPLRKPDR